MPPTMLHGSALPTSRGCTGSCHQPASMPPMQLCPQTHAKWLEKADLGQRKHRRTQLDESFPTHQESSQSIKFQARYMGWMLEAHGHAAEADMLAQPPTQAVQACCNMAMCCHMGVHVCAHVCACDGGCVVCTCVMALHGADIACHALHTHGEQRMCVHM